MNRITLVSALVIAFTLPMFAATSQAPEQLTKKQIAQLIATAKTPADHQRIAAYYRAEADRLIAESNEHANMAAGFRRNAPNKSTAFQVDHCEYLARTLRVTADKALASAAEHERMAQGANEKDTPLPGHDTATNR